jgi:hypothetical protein
MSSGSRATSETRTKAVAAVFLACAVALSARFAAKFWSDRIDETTSHPFVGGTFGDLRDAIWLPVRSLLAGGDPYDTATYLQNLPYAQDFPTYAPAHLALWLPIGWLDWHGAMVASLTINLLIVAAVGSWGGIRTLRTWTGRRPGIAPALAAAGAGVSALWLARTVTAAVGPGQPSVVYALVAAPVALGVRHRWAGAVLFALTCLKPQVGLIVLVVLLAQRRWREAAGGVAIAGGVSLVVAAVLADGIGGMGRWLGVFLGNVRSATSVREGQATVEERIDLEAILLSIDVHLPGIVSALLAVAGLVLVYAVVRWTERHDLRAAGVLLGLGIGLLPIYHISYDAAWLAVPLAVCAAELYRCARMRALYACAPGVVTLAAGTWLARWHGFDERFGTGTGVVIQRVLLLVGLVALAAGVLATVRDAGRTGPHEPGPGGPVADRSPAAH